MKAENFFDQLNNCQLLRKSSITWSYLYTLMEWKYNYHSKEISLAISRRN